MRRRSFSHPGSSGGFTLLELLLILGIVATVVVLASPRVKRSFDEMTFQFSVRDLERAIRFSQYRAIWDGRIYGLTIDPSYTSYQIVRKHFGKGAPTEKILAPWARKRTLPGGIRFDPRTHREILFFPDGSSTRGIVVLKREGIGPIALKIDPAYGGFRVARE